MLDVLKYRRPEEAGSRGKGRIEIDDVAITFGRGAAAHRAVEPTTITIEPGQFVCILGPSGCGKSTLMNAVAGYTRPTTGQVRVDGAVIEKPGPDRGMVFQQYSLLPWKTVYENVAFGPKMAGHGKVEASSIANTFLNMVGLAKFGNRYPAELSGGMQQRVGIARALANYPSVLLMDEPFGALDAQTRLMMQESLLEIWRKFGTTVLFVTHDVDEAVFLADRVLIMSAAPGRIIEDLAIDLPRPRRPDIAVDPAYIAAKQHCLSAIRTESRRAFEEQNK
ncbi:MAG: ABC transporter ATP-binding protein [Confluentimicrobium sp.]|jgi:NitT/TauT family transport system ATP-binding protein|uniref:ABC transporter ATP-binding protein n=1 Tax=Actibacterium sp. TaxID=1872125 RepID=UPI000691EB59|nr:ABC transporter ATP-binding protein [Actibacterium sp.]MBC58213.1 ABC transporter ATP-binding protein [Actibacterium sp.]MDY6859327.1 ABC transporter ATP-binding protein [Pseudomonadota bacterium]|tara:strand:- start:3309 stop:4145 length:837 start_codon:yes stop_codon:yes gene_type:complete